MSRLGKIDLASDVKNFEQRIKEERSLRQNIKILPFGIPYLDDCLNGIRHDDLILIGARTGSGKTQLATTIALHNATIGKRVVFFALEAADYEIERRIKYQIISNLYYKKRTNQFVDLNYMDWNDGLINDEIIVGIEKEIEEVWSTQFTNLSVIYRSNSSYHVEDLEKKILSLQDQADIFIIDHLHFFDFDDANENAAYKRIMKKISDLNQKLGKPVVLIAHLRKSDRSAKTLIPSEEDFHGTSDIVKIPTKIITMAAAKDMERNYQQIENKEWLTYVRIAKCRGDMARTKYPALLSFSQKHSSYLPEYTLGELSYDETKWTRLSDNYKPNWAKGSKNGIF